MKRLLYYSLVVLVCIACGEDQGDRALVSGTIKGLTNDTLIIYGADQMFDHVDTIYVKDGKFKRYITVDTLAQTLRLQIEDKAENHLLTEFLNEHDTTLTVALIDTFITHHPTSTVSFYLINHYLQEAATADRKQVTPLLQQFDEELKHHPQYLAINERLTTEAKADSGASVSYFRIRDLDNKWSSRADFADKWLLIHFWASWDEASLRQVRTLYKPLYKQLKKDKTDYFALWGISLDVDRQQWKNAVQKDTLDWTQGCDAKGWSSEPVTMFDIRYLPANVLVSPNGKISAVNLTKEQIEAKLKELKEEKEKEKKEKKRK